MSHPIHRVTRFSIVGPYTLTVGFSDDTEQRIDFEPVLKGALFGPLQDLATFNAVRLDDEAGTLVWPTGRLCGRMERISIQPRCMTGLRRETNLPVALRDGLMSVIALLDLNAVRYLIKPAPVGWLVCLASIGLSAVQTSIGFVIARTYPDVARRHSWSVENPVVAGPA